MACYHPIPAKQDAHGAPVQLWPPVGSATLELPCGTCLGCRQDLATQWAHRAQLEASLYANNCFLTLTYDDETDHRGRPHLPEGGHLRPKDLQRFLKRLRRGLDRQTPTIASAPITTTFEKRLKKGYQGPRQLVTRTQPRVRFLACGEYGDRTDRPHFHLLLFNCDFTDKKRVAKNLYESDTLKKFWKKGAHRLGELSGASANYVAQYSLKKLVTQDDRHDEYGELYHPPFIRMSLKPPIGYQWLEQYKADLQHGYLIRNARKQKIPRGIRKQLAKLDPQLAEQAAYAAQAHIKTKHDLRAAEIIHHSKNQLFHSRTL